MKKLMKTNNNLNQNWKGTKIRKQSKGITLIALVVIIIVLLILAGVSIQMLTGQTGILKQAQSAVDITKEKTTEEEVELLVYDSLDNEGNFNVEKFKNKITKNGGRWI